MQGQRNPEDKKVVWGRRRLVHLSISKRPAQYSCVKALGAVSGIWMYVATLGR